MEEKNNKKKLKDIIFWKSNSNDKNNKIYCFLSFLIQMLSTIVIFLLAFSVIGGLIK